MTRGDREVAASVAALFEAHRTELTDLALAAGSLSPRTGIADAFADCIAHWRSIDDPLTYLRRRAIALGDGAHPREVVAWLRDRTAADGTRLDDAAIADLIELSPAEIVSMSANRRTP
jgi:hypothetical protein